MASKDCQSGGVEFGRWKLFLVDTLKDGALWCEDAISPRQALALAMVVDE